VVAVRTVCTLMLPSCWSGITHLNYSHFLISISPSFSENFKHNVSNIKYETHIKFKHSNSLPYNRMRALLRYKEMYKGSRRHNYTDCSISVFYDARFS
jgi:hypothetical protein